MKTRAVIVSVVSVVIVVALVLAVFFLNQATQLSKEGYWVLEISSAAGGYIQPNGTVHVPMNQAGINVTATATGWNGFGYWTLDGERVENQSSTIFVPKQELNSTHTLQAAFIHGTPPLYRILNEQITVNAISYNAYNFTLPTEISQATVYGSFAVSNASQSGIKVYLMNSTNFADWLNGQSPVSFFPSGGAAVNGTFNVVLASGGEYFLVYDNTSGASLKQVDTDAYFWYTPKN